MILPAIFTILAGISCLMMSVTIIATAARPVGVDIFTMTFWLFLTILFTGTAAVIGGIQ